MEKIHIINPKKDLEVRGALCLDSIISHTFCGLSTLQIGEIGNYLKPQKEKDGTYHKAYCKKCLRIYLKQKEVLP